MASISDPGSLVPRQEPEGCPEPASLPALAAPPVPATEAAPDATETTATAAAAVATEEPSTLPTTATEAGPEAPEAAAPAAAMAEAVPSPVPAAPAAAAAGHSADLQSYLCPPEDDPQEVAAKEKVNQILNLYRARMELRASEGRAKPDMISYKELKDSLTPADRHGHVPGVRPGEMFTGRGDLAILGLHKQILRGIDSNTKTPGAYAIVLSGGYEDDADEGESFWYTGEGGQEGKKQLHDQTFTRGNLALQQSHQLQLPVRVFRGSLDEAGKRQYVYEGLYLVRECKQEASKSGPLVCKFLMQGIPGHSTATVKVEYNCLSKAITRLKSIKLAGAGPSAGRGRGGRQPASKRRKTQGGQAQPPSREDLLRSYAGRPGLVCADISQGAEALVPIPLFNEVDGEGLPADFAYVADYVWAPGVEDKVRPVLSSEAQRMQQYVDGNGQAPNGTCGLKFNAMMAEMDRQLPVLPRDYEVTNEASYNPSGLLIATDPCGVHECGPDCKGAKCKNNMQVARGLALPLEVYKTAAKGFAVRCSQPIPAGQFVVAYVGELITDAMAENLRGQDHYLMALDFFMHIYQELHERGIEGISQELPMHKIPPPPDRSTFPVDCLGITSPTRQAALAASSSTSPAPAHAVDESDFSPLLVIDAARRGNVARFINHSCEGNLTIQAVFTRQCRSTVLYYMALFANQEIAPLEELTYNYGYSKQRESNGAEGVPQRGMVCHCGSKNCCKILL